MVSSAALSCPGATKGGGWGGGASPVWEFGHYRSRREGPVISVWKEKLSVAGLHAELVKKIQVHPPPPTSRLEMFVCFQASAGSKKVGQTKIFLLVVAYHFLYTAILKRGNPDGFSHCSFHSKPIYRCSFWRKSWIPLNVKTVFLRRERWWRRNHWRWPVFL